MTRTRLKPAPLPGAASRSRFSRRENCPGDTIRGLLEGKSRAPARNAPTATRRALAPGAWLGRLQRERKIAARRRTPARGVARTPGGARLLSVPKIRVLRRALAGRSALALAASGPLPRPSRRATPKALPAAPG